MLPAGAFAPPTFVLAEPRWPLDGTQLRRDAPDRSERCPSERGSADAEKVGLEFAGAVAEAVLADADAGEDRQQQVRHRRVLRIREGAAGRELAAERAGEQAWQIGGAMQVAVGHAAPGEDEGGVGGGN